MREAMEHALAEALEESPNRLLEVVEHGAGRNCKAALGKVLAKCSRNVADEVCDALLRRVSGLLECFEASSEVPDERVGTLVALRGCALVVQAGVAATSKGFETALLYPTVLRLHDKLVKLEEDQDLQEVIAGVCETWWRSDFENKECLVAQSLPFLVSRSLESLRKVDVRRVYALRGALALFDFADESVEDFKHLLIRCLLTPTYLRSPEGCRFISCLFGLNAQFVKELVALVRSQIPFSTKSSLAAYGDILYRAWKDSEQPCLQEIEENCIQGLIEGAIYSSNKSLASSVRRVLDGFISQKAQDGVEGMLFRLNEPILFRSLQVANSDVRRNALLLLVEVFPLQNPQASKEEKEALLEKQISLLEKLLLDPCPDIRCTAVEGVCRILRFFWEVLPSATTVKLLTAVVDDMANDQTSTAVRLAVIAGLTYLLENPQSHSLLQALLPRVGPLLNDSALSVRIAAADLLLEIKGIRALHFHKVVKLDFLLSCLATDNSLVGRRLTKLLIPSYLPSKLSPAEACRRCITLIRRAPEAGVNFCKWALVEGVSSELLLELVRALSSNDIHKDSGESSEGIVSSLLEICCVLAAEKEGQRTLAEVIDVNVLTSLLNRACTSQERSSILRIASLLPPTEVPKLVAHCGNLVLSCRAGASPAVVQEMKAVHALILAWGGFDDLVEALIKLFKHVSDLMPRNEHLLLKDSQDGTGSHKGRKRRKSAWLKAMAVKNTSEQENQNPAAGPLEESMEDSLVVAAGAARQIESLLAEDGTREALLSCNAQPELVRCLREVARFVVSRTHDGPQMHGRMQALPALLAYSKLSIHLAVQEDAAAECEIPGSKTPKTGKKVGQTSSKQPPSAPSLKSADALLEELVGWSTTVHKASIPEASRPCQSSPPPLQPKAKYARKSTRKHRSREPLQPLPGNSSGEEIPLQTLTGRASVLATTMQSISEVLSLRLVTSTSSKLTCASFAKNAVLWSKTCMELFCNTSAADVSIAMEQKDFLMYAKVSATHAAKMVHLSLRHCPDIWVNLSELAHSLLDLLAASDSMLGALPPFTAALRHWLPDLLISVTTLPDNMVSAVSRQEQFEAFAFNDGKRTLRPWVTYAAKSAFSLMDPSEVVAIGVAAGDKEDLNKEGDRPEGTVGKSCDMEGNRDTSTPKVSGVFVDTLVKLVRKGSGTVAQEFIGMLVGCTLSLYSSQEYSLVVGLLDVICHRLLGCRPPNQRGLDVTLTETTLGQLEELQVQVGVARTSEEPQAHSQTADKLLRLILASYKEGLV